MCVQDRKKMFLLCFALLLKLLFTVWEKEIHNPIATNTKQATKNVQKVIKWVQLQQKVNQIVFVVSANWNEMRARFDCSNMWYQFNVSDQDHFVHTIIIIITI